MQIQTEQPKNGADEHILVCLSSSPSNARIIHTAAKMAKVLHAKFTAIYVQTDSVESEKNRLRLEQNIQLAQGLGAEIIMTHGEDVPLQISEYVRSRFWSHLKAGHIPKSVAAHPRRAS